MYTGRIKLTGSIDDDIYTLLINNEEAIKANLNEASYLYDYIRGIQDVSSRIRPFHPEDTQNVIENRARQIIDFKTSYEFAFPVYYINNSDNEEKRIDVLNTLALMDNQAAKHLELMEWAYATGAGYLGIFNNPEYTPDSDEIPYYTAPIASDKAFVIYSDDGRDKIIAGGMYDTFVKEDKEYTRLQAYYRKVFYTWIKAGGEISFDELENLEREIKPSPFGIPVVEYPLNPARVGFVELVKDLLDAVNNINSNRIENIADIVQSFLWLHNVSLGSDSDERTEKHKELRQNGLLETTGNTDLRDPIIRYVSQVLNQTDAQTTKDDLLDAIFDIVGLPNRNMQLSNIEKTGAMLMGGGYQRAESMAQKTAIYFTQSEMKSLKKRLDILREIAQDNYDIKDIKLNEIAITTTRNPNLGAYEKAMTANLLISSKLASPEDALEIAGFADSSRINRNRKMYWDNIIEVNTSEKEDNNNNI